MTGVKHVRSPNQLERIEDALINQLKTFVSKLVKVESYPGDPNTYDFSGLECAILVHYRSSKYKASKDVGNNAQKRRVNFSLVLLSRTLRDQTGIYQTLEDMRLAIQGQSFEGSDAVEIVSDDLIREIKGQWQWEIVIGLNLPAVARNYQHPANLTPNMRKSQKDQFND